MKVKVHECDICGYDKNITNSKKHNMSLCKKHYDQIQYNGKVTDPRKPKPNLKINEYILFDSYAEIIVYDKYGYENARTKIDLKYIEKCKAYKWYLNSTGYVVSTLTKISLHRFITNTVNNKEVEIVDHVDNDKLNNLECNLRIANKSQNAFNVIKPRITNKSGFTGVYFAKNINKWRAGITVNRKNISLGSYSDIEDAAKARAEAEIKYFGEFTPNRIEGEL